MLFAGRAVMRHCVRFFAASSFLCGMAQAGGFTSFDFPGATDTTFLCVNALGDLCGGWTDSAGFIHGLYIPHDGAAQTIDFPGAEATYIIGLNRQGDSVGNYGPLMGTGHAFRQLNGQPATEIDPPGSNSAIARGINDSGSIAGAYDTKNGPSHGFILTGSSYQTIDYPQATSTDAWDIDNAGDVVGFYTAADQSMHGFLLKNGMFASIDFPGASSTVAVRVLEDGRILGFYTLPDGTDHGFLLYGGVYTSIDVPGSSHTRTRGLNASGEVVGRYVDASGHAHAFTTVLGPAPSSSAPLFPMTVTGNITATSANVQAQVQPPSQLVGATASIYVFAHVRQSLLSPKSVDAKDGSTPDPCVLAQLNQNGQLVAASASSLQPYATGVLSSQSQAVTILNNVSPSNVAGASFFVGYGTTSDGMLASGLYQGAVTVPGSDSCSAALLTGAAPNAPGPLTGLWWNPNESGWGIHFTQRRNIVFAAWYTYDTNGNPKWYVASDCAMPSGTTGATGRCNGTLYEVNGPTFFGAAFNPALVNIAAAGSLQVDFADANTASMSYTVAGVSRTVSITRQPIASGTIAPAVDYSDLWWNANESGWGMAVAQQYGVMFLAWYVYDGNGAPTWYVASDCVVVGSGCSGTLYRTTGPAFGPTFDPSRIQLFTVGTVTLGFGDANNATLSYTVNGATASKAVTRQLF